MSMNSADENDKYAKLRNLLWRIFQGFGSLLGIVCSPALVYLCYREGKKQMTLSEKIVLIIKEEFFVALFIACCLGFAWEVARPKWIERLVGKRALAAIGLLLLWLIAGLLLGIN
jgi:hypothetical protein